MLEFIVVNNIPLFNLTEQFSGLEKKILEGWKNLLREANFTSGPETEKFQAKFAKFIGSTYSLGVRSGTASLMIALKAAGVEEGDEVITTPMTFAATADVISLMGAKPVFVDVLADTGNIDPAEIEKKITTKTKAILIVHLYGVPAELKSILKIAKKHKLHLIEDASHAHGSLYDGKRVGSFGIAGCFSLYPSKTLGAAGNAGVITSSSGTFMKKAEGYSHHGILDKKNKYLHAFPGWNELLDNVQAVVLLEKMNFLEKWIKEKRRIVEIYNVAFQKSGHPGMYFPQNTIPSFYVYAVQMKKRDEFAEFMKKKGIETGVYYPVPLHLQKSYQYLGHKKGDFPVAENFARQTISLPLYAELQEKQIQQITSAIATYFSSES